MKTLVVYDSVFGNTEQIARSIAGALPGTVKLSRVDGVSPQDLAGVDLLVLGSPTVGGRATKQMQELVASITPGIAEKLRLAAFDTRIGMRMVQIFGYAGPRLAEILTNRGAVLALPPEGFLVKGRNGPLADGEVQRAAEWARSIRP